MIKTGAAAVGIGLVLAIGLVGCAPASPTAGPTTTPSSATPSPTNSPAPPAATKPALADLVVTPNGLGDLAVGAAVPVQSPDVAIMTYNATRCVSAALGVAAGAPGAGAWLANYPDGSTSLGTGAPFDVGPVPSASSPIAVIALWSPELETAKHVGVGSTPAELTAAYGSQLTLDSADNSDVYVLPGTRSELLFEVAKAASGLADDQLGTVVWMRIVPLHAQYLHIANTDAVGSCSG